MNLVKQLKNLNACDPAIEWVNGGSNPEKLWNECERGDWMLWLVNELDLDIKRLVLATCQCARLIIHLNDDLIGLVEIGEAWIRNEVTSEELDRIAKVAAWAYAPIGVAWITRPAAWAKEITAWIAKIGKITTLKQCADIVRQHFTFDEIWEALSDK